MILESYIQKEIRTKLFWLIGLLILILTSHRFVDYLADAASGKIPGHLILHMLTMKILALLPRLLPIAIFLSVILALTRLSSDKELTIMAGSGLSSGFQMGTIFKFSVLFGFVVFLASFYLSPWAEQEVSYLKDKARLESDITGISAGRFKEFGNGDRVVYVKELSNDRQSMQQVFLQIRDQYRLSLLSSDRARFKFDDNSGNRYILFENGHRYVGTPGKLDFQVTEYQTYAVVIEEGGTEAGSGKLETIPTADLFGSNTSGYRAEIQWRLAYVIAALLLPLLAVVLNRFSFGDNRYVSLIIGILIYLIYSNLLSISKTLVARGSLAPWIGLWWVHVLLIAAIVAIFKLQGAIHKIHGDRLRHSMPVAS